MTQYTDEIRTCVRPECNETFRVKVRGKIQVYCSAYCRLRFQVDHTPVGRENARRRYREYYSRNSQRRNLQRSEIRRRKCECGGLKAAAEDLMCADCAEADGLSPSTNQARRPASRGQQADKVERDARVAAVFYEKGADEAALAFGITARTVYRAVARHQARMGIVPTDERAA